MEQLYGTYRGFAPTDESPIAMGELEVTINESSVRTRMATGLKIETDDIPLSELKPMTRDQLRGVYVDESPYIDRSVGFSVDGLSLIFLPDAGDDEMGLLIHGRELADMLGPTILFSPRQVERGVYARALEAMHREYGPNCIPLLENDGKNVED